MHIEKDASGKPKVYGPYSPIVVAQNFAFCSGQIGLTAGNEHDVVAQTTEAIASLEKLLTSVNFSIDDVVKTEVYLQNISDFESMNTVYATFFQGAILPARVTVEVAKLPKGALVEISCIAVKK